MQHPLPRRGLLAGLAAVPPLVALSACQVQGGADEANATFPTRAVDFWVPFDAGGSGDLISRAVAKAAEEQILRRALAEDLARRVMQRIQALGATAAVSPR